MGGYHLWLLKVGYISETLFLCVHLKVFGTELDQQEKQPPPSLPRSLTKRSTAAGSSRLLNQTAPRLSGPADQHRGTLPLDLRKNIYGT